MSQRQHDVVPAERAVPRKRLLIAGVDERPVDVEERCARYEVAAFVFAACCSCFPSANSSISFLLNAGMSSGLRLVTRPWSTCTSSSTQLAPALRRSVRTDGNDVSVRSRTTPASISVHGAWQIAPK